MGHVKAVHSNSEVLRDLMNEDRFFEVMEWQLEQHYQKPPSGWSTLFGSEEFIGITWSLYYACKDGHKLPSTVAKELAQSLGLGLGLVEVAVAVKEKDLAGEVCIVEEIDVLDFYERMKLEIQTKYIEPSYGWSYLINSSVFTAGWIIMTKSYGGDFDLLVKKMGEFFQLKLKPQRQKEQKTPLVIDTNIGVNYNDIEQRRCWPEDYEHENGNYMNICCRL